MRTLIELPQWHALAQHHAELRDCSIRAFMQADAQRFDQFSLTAAGLLLDFSKNRITATTLALFEDLFEAIALRSQIQAMFMGAPVNSTEQRPALHTALRSAEQAPLLVNGLNIRPLIEANLHAMQQLVERVHNNTWLEDNQPITDIVNIGVGGSDLGPAMATQALKPYHHPALRFHFVSNLDSAHIEQILAPLNAARTLFIVSSKSFSTQETLVNARKARAWFQQQGQQAIQRHFIAVTYHQDRALAAGFDAATIFPVWEWVGGRYSLWSAIGLPIALAIGMPNFRAFLQGARAMDEHFQTAPLRQNMPVILSLLNIWYTNFFGSRVQAILPYAQNLALLPGYLQQASMESTGKCVSNDGTAVTYATGSVLFGVAGTNGQHAFYQLLHQGTQLVPSDFIVTINPHTADAEQHAALFANALGQSKALCEGKDALATEQELLGAGLSSEAIRQLLPHKILAGNQPCNTLVLTQLTPQALGALLALYEHRIFVDSCVWNINAFDQWSVEQGKKLAKQILPNLLNADSAVPLDSSTQGLIRYYQSQKTRLTKIT